MSQTDTDVDLRPVGFFVGFLHVCEVFFPLCQQRQALFEENVSSKFLWKSFNMEMRMIEKNCSGSEGVTYSR